MQFWCHTSIQISQVATFVNQKLFWVSVLTLLKIWGPKVKVTRWQNVGKNAVLEQQLHSNMAGGNICQWKRLPWATLKGKVWPRGLVTRAQVLLTTGRHLAKTSLVVWYLATYQAKTCVGIFFCIIIFYQASEIMEIWLKWYGLWNISRKCTA